MVLVSALLLGVVGPLVGVADAAAFDVTVAAGGNDPDADPPVSGEVIGFADGIDVDPGGNLWVTDRNDGVIRRFPAGSTGDTPADCVLDVSPNALYVRDVAVDGLGRAFVSINREIRLYDSPCEPSGVAAILDVPDATNLAVGADGVYFTQSDGVYRAAFDVNGDLVKQPDPEDPSQLVVVPEVMVPTGLSNGVPQDVAMGPAGELFVSAEEAGVWRFAPDDLPVGPGTVDETWPGGAPVVIADGLPGLRTIAVDAGENVFVDLATGIGRVPPPGAGGPVNTEPSDTWRRCRALSAAEADSEPCIVLDESIIGDAITAGLLDPSTPTTTANVFGGNVAVDSDGNVYANASGRFGPSELNLVFRIEGAGEAAEPPELPVLVPGGAWGPEGDSGSTVVQVPITLSAPATEPVTVAWETFPYAGEALATSGADYAPSSGTVTIPAGELTGYAPVTIFGDTLDEYEILGGEFLFVRFFDPSPNVVLDTSFFGLGAYVIQDDDPPPAIAPGTVTIAEGDAGTRTVSIPVNLSAPSGRTITVDWTTTSAGTATADADYVTGNGVLTFDPGDTATTIDIAIIGDTESEPDEWLVTQITDPTNATIGGYFGLGIAVIEDDD